MSYADGRYTLLNSVSVAGAGGQVQWNGGPGVFSSTGTPGGSSVRLEYSPDPDANGNGVTWIPVDRSGDTYVTFTTLPAGGEFDLPPGPIRANAVGGSPVSVSAYAAYAGS